jgi:BlaI family transcriptional regulator, penicillinase repressor
MRPTTPNLTEQELEIMKIVWERGESTVRDIYEAILEKRKVAYTTVMTMMKILEQKGHLKRTGGEKAFIYAPTKPKQQVIRSMVKDFVERVFNGSAEPLMMHLVEEKHLSEDECKEIEKLLRARRKS